MEEIDRILARLSKEEIESMEGEVGKVENQIMLQIKNGMDSEQLKEYFNTNAMPAHKKQWIEYFIHCNARTGKQKVTQGFTPEKTIPLYKKNWIS